MSRSVFFFLCVCVTYFYPFLTQFSSPLSIIHFRISLHPSSFSREFECMWHKISTREDYYYTHILSYLSLSLLSLILCVIHSFEQILFISINFVLCFIQFCWTKFLFPFKNSFNLKANKSSLFHYENFICLLYETKLVDLLNFILKTIPSRGRNDIVDSCC